MVRVLATVVNLGGWGWALSTLVPLALLSFPDGRLPGRGWRALVGVAVANGLLVTAAGVLDPRGGLAGDVGVSPSLRWFDPQPSAGLLVGVGGRGDRRVCGCVRRSRRPLPQGGRCRSAAGAVAAPGGARRGDAPPRSRPFSTRSPSCSASSRSCWCRPRSPWRSCVTSWSTSGSWCPARCSTSLLTGVVVAGYLGLVAILDQTVRGTSLGSSVLATVLVALAVNPVRVWLQRLVHRAFYGARRRSRPGVRRGRCPAPGGRDRPGPGPRWRPRGAVPGAAAARRRHRDGRRGPSRPGARCPRTGTR